jgi:hypothetical protein
VENNHLSFDHWGGFDINYWIDFYADTASSNWYWPYREYANKWHHPVAVTNWAMGNADKFLINLSISTSLNQYLTSR